MDPGPMAPELQVAQWLNSDAPLTLAQLRGKVVVLHAFQMLCPGCVSHAVPQAERLHRMLPREQAVVVGLHTVFEHHEAMTVDALRVFLAEFRIRFPVGVDAPGPDGDPLPRTMRAYGMQGTPTLVLIGRDGRVRAQEFGRVDDLGLGLTLGQLLMEPASP